MWGIKVTMSTGDAMAFDNIESSVLVDIKRAMINGGTITLGNHTLNASHVVFIYTWKEEEESA